MHPHRSLLFALLLPLSLPVVAQPAAPAAAPRYVPAAARVAAIEAALPAAPAPLGAVATDRAAWEKAAKAVPVPAVLESARALAAKPPPDLPESLYLDYTRTGNRVNYQRVNKERLDRVGLFAWAEGLTHTGEFIPPLVREIEAILAERTWVLPAHDKDNRNFRGEVVEIDLGAAMRGWSLATAVAWHADQLPAALRERTAAELRRRIIEPFLGVARGAEAAGGMWWFRADNNWNAVCNLGVAGTALAALPSRTERAEIVANVELNLEYYLAGFSPDGYCSEGIGYWNYGFGHFAMGAEMLARATGGLVRLLATEHAVRVAGYPAGLRILDGVYPAFADMDVRERPSSWFGALAVRQFFPRPLGMKPWGLKEPDLRSQLLYETALKVFLAIETEGLPPAPAPAVRTGHHWFAEAQVYTARGRPGFGAAIKGGHNGEHHNHNDVGSYVVALGDRAVLVDPGLEVYTARTFGPDRYVSKVLNSYGHPVPVVAGRLQSTGKAFAARVVATTFTEAADTLVLDLSGAYEVPALRTLTRTFVLKRGRSPEITVTDEVSYAEPSTFETALVTFEPWKEVRKGRLQVGADPNVLRVEIAVDGAEWTLRSEVIDEALPANRKPTRLGVSLTSPVTSAKVRVRVIPPPSP
jgi:hypothetical protein